MTSSTRTFGRTALSAIAATVLVSACAQRQPGETAGDSSPMSAAAGGDRDP
jgi:hypothetical protein